MRQVGVDKVDAKYLDDVIDVLGQVMSEQLAHMGKGTDDNVLVSVSSHNLRALLDYCAILRPLLDAVELGEVEQYKKGLKDGRREGRCSMLGEVARLVESYGLDGMKTKAEVAEQLRSLESRSYG